MLDGGWSTQQPGNVQLLDENGLPVPDPTRFPHGMKALAAEVHGLGLKFGLWNIRGVHQDAVAKNLRIKGILFLPWDLIFEQNWPRSHPPRPPTVPMSLHRSGRTPPPTPCLLIAHLQPMVRCTSCRHPVQLRLTRLCGRAGGGRRAERQLPLGQGVARGEPVAPSGTGLLRLAGRSLRRLGRRFPEGVGSHRFRSN